MTDTLDMRHRGIDHAAERGFTLLELMIVVAIVAIIAGIGVPQYASALRVARVGKARHELISISQAVDSYLANHGGQLPLTLYQVGFGGKMDPWGVPYCYLNYSDGTGDGLQWAISAGLVDPSAVIACAAPRRGGAQLAGLAGLFSSQVPPGGGGGAAGARAVAANATSLTAAIAARLGRPAQEGELDALAAAIKASQGFSMFTLVATEQTRRRDRYMVPLNTDYDLFSLGPNGRTTVALGEALGQDDVIRANNGGFFGTASDY